VLPAGDAQAVAGAAVAQAQGECRWQLEAGADPGPGHGPQPRQTAARPDAPLGARGHPGPRGQPHPAPGPAGHRPRPATYPHERAFGLLHSDGARASELAYRALLAGEAEAASRSSVQAGDEALAVFAVEEAIGHYQKARALLQEPKRIQTEFSAAEVERLYTHLGQAHAFQNAWDKAQQAYEELLAYAQHQRQFTLVSMTLNRLAILAVQQPHDKPQVQALLEQAWHMAQSSSDQKA